MAKRNTNKIIEASLRDEEYDEEQEQIEVGQEGDEEFDSTDLEVLTDDDVMDDLENMTSDQKAQVNRSRKRGQSHSDRGHESHTAEREHATASEEETDFSWRPTNTLDAPPALPGMEQRWIRVSVGADSDPQNLAKARRGRWVPRTLDTVPKRFAPPTAKHGSLGTVIAVGDLILCHRDRRIGASRRKYFREKQAQQMAAGKRYIRKAEVSGHKIMEVDRDLKPTIGTGRRVRAQDDE